MFYCTMWNELSNLPIVLRSKLKQIQSNRISNESIMEVESINQSINHVALSVCVASRYSALKMDLLITLQSSNDHITYHNTSQHITTHHNNNNNNNNNKTHHCEHQQDTD